MWGGASVATKDVMADSPREKAHSLRQVTSPPPLSSSSSLSSPSPALSPLVQLLPTGYRDIQPFQKGKGWHTNGKQTSHTDKLRRPRDAARNGIEAGEKVVFPVIPTYESKRLGVESPRVGGGGPKAGAVERCDGDERQELEEEDGQGGLEMDLTPEDEAKQADRVSSPSVASIPVPPSAPRRPGRGDNNNQVSGSSSSSFRTRAIAAAAGGGGVGVAASSPNSSHPPSICAVSHEPFSSVRGHAADDTEEPPTQLDPAVAAKLWQEYADRTKSTTKTIDKDAYHRKMHHRYNELKTLRDRIAKLESELTETRRERDEAREVVSRNTQQSVIARWKDSDNSEEHAGEMATTRAGQQQQLVPSSPTTHTSTMKAQQTLSSEEVSYREKCFKLERALTKTKENLSAMHTALTEQHESDHDTIATLQAKLLLEQETSQLLSRQLHEANTAFQATADELVMTQMELEKEQIHKTIVMEHIQEQTDQLITDHRRKELQNRVRNVIRNLGKEALHQKMEALHTRVLIAEQSMRTAQLQVANLKAERDAQDTQLEQILSSSALKYHSLAGDGGIPGILQRSTQLYYGSRVVNHQFLLVQILYEDERNVSQYGRGSEEVMADSYGNERFRMHFVFYEASTAQDDYLTFQLRDIKRLVPDHGSYLALYPDRKQERLQELAERLLQHVHVGYKNGHLVVAEMPSALPSNVFENERREVNIYRGTRYLPFTMDNQPRFVLAEVAVNEVYAASTSELWWLEIRALSIESDGLLLGCESQAENCDGEFFTKVDLQQLRGVCSHFGSYRPSESMAVGKRGMPSQEKSELFSIHEELLEPVLAKLGFVMERDSSANGDPPAADQERETRIQLCVVDLPSHFGDAIKTQPLDDDKPEPGRSERDDAAEALVSNASEMDPAEEPQSVLDHRCIVNISDVFYCVRIQEVWDAELMLEIRMEDPESLSHFHLVIHEKELMKVAVYLFESGAVGENYASQVKYGLPRSLHNPICRILKKHMHPLVSLEAADDSGGGDARRQAGGESERGEISIGSLLEEISSISGDSMAESHARSIETGNDFDVTR